MTVPHAYRRTTGPAPRPAEWDRPVRHWPAALLAVLTLGLGLLAATMPTSGGALTLVGCALLPLGPLLGLVAVLLPSVRRRPATLVAATSPEGLVLRGEPAVTRLVLIALLAGGLVGPAFAVDTLLAGQDAVLPPLALSLALFVATLAGLPAAWEMRRGRIRGAEMTLGPQHLVVDSLSTTRTVMWSRVLRLEPLPGPGARVRVHSSGPIDRVRRGSTGRGRATDVREVPQLAESFSLGAYAGDPAVLLAALRALTADPDAAARHLRSPDPGQAVADL